VLADMSKSRKRKAEEIWKNMVDQDSSAVKNKMAQALRERHSTANPQKLPRKKQRKLDTVVSIAVCLWHNNFVDDGSNFW
jgi:hypothetical protein